MISQEEQALKLNIGQLSDLLGPDHLAVADAWVNLGLQQLDAANGAGAETAFSQALAIRRIALGDSDETVTHIHFYLGRSYSESGDYAAAKSSFEKCLEIYEEECRPEDTFLASVLDALASLHHENDEYTDAESCLKRSLFIRLCVLEPVDPAIAESLNHLGWLYSQNGHYQRAEDLFLSALDIWLYSYGLDHAHTAMCLENYAFVLTKTGRTDEAGEILHRVKSIRALPDSCAS